jgi:hypothetical protein
LGTLFLTQSFWHNKHHFPSAIPIIRKTLGEIDGSKGPHPWPSSTTGRLPHRHPPEPPATGNGEPWGTGPPKAENTTGSGKRRRSDSLTIGDWRSSYVYIIIYTS